MTSKEFDKIEPVYRNINNQIEISCKNQGIDFYNYLGVFLRYLVPNYFKLKSKIDLIKKLDFNDSLKVRAILNTRYFGNKEYEIKKCTEQFNKSRDELFKWLDKTETPYFFILNPYFEYNSGIDYKSFIDSRHGYKKDLHSGVRNIDLCIDYAKYKVYDK